MPSNLRFFGAIGLLFFMSFACTGARSEATPKAPEASPVLTFSLPRLDGRLVESEQLRGRVTVLLFLTTFDVASQAQARRLEDLYRTHTPRLNALGVVVEAPRYAALAGEYRESLGLSYPLVMGERAVLDAHEELRHVKSVPAWIILSPDGEIVNSAAGALNLDELGRLVREAEVQ